MNHLLDNDLISSDQLGFVRGQSCVAHLLEVLDSLTLILDAGGSVDTIYTDFWMAFDTVPHCRLLSKVAAYNIHSRVWQWIRAFLSVRQLRVVVNDSYSTPVDVTNGILQGSMQGPALFIIYISNLPHHMSVQYNCLLMT